MHILERPVDVNEWVALRRSVHIYARDYSGAIDVVQKCAINGFGMIKGLVNAICQREPVIFVVATILVPTRNHALVAYATWVRGDRTRIMQSCEHPILELEPVIWKAKVAESENADHRVPLVDAQKYAFVCSGIVHCRRVGA